MPILRTARLHFDEDIIRARSLVTHANTLPATTLRDDIFRAAWMMAVGASDAFFCDAYADLATRTLQARQIQPSFRITDKMLNLRVPAIAVIGTAATENWRWRMAARQVIENETVLSIAKIKSLLNQFFRDNHKPFSDGNFDAWIVRNDARNRLFGISPRIFRALAGNAKHTQRAVSIKKFEARFEIIFQRRHDCIHNCDRPKVALDTTNLTESAIEKVISDIVFLICRVQGAVVTEFPNWLTDLGATGATRGRVLQ
jgi:hypothetical protein